MIIDPKLSQLMDERCLKLISEIDKIRSYFLDQFNFDEVVTDRIKGPLIHHVQLNLHAAASQLEMVRMHLKSDK